MLAATISGSAGVAVGAAVAGADVAVGAAGSGAGVAVGSGDWLHPARSPAAAIAAIPRFMIRSLIFTQRSFCFGSVRDAYPPLSAQTPQRR